MQTTEKHCGFGAPALFQQLAGGWTKPSASVAGFTCLAALLALLSAVPIQAQSLQLRPVSEAGSVAHIMPTVENAAALRAANAQRPAGFASAGFSGALSYHGGPVIVKATTYAIFWIPASGALTLHYQTVQTNLLKDYPGHSIANNNTQYYQGSTTKTFIQNAGTFGGSYVDTSSYPVSDCTDSATPGNCISDALIQQEIVKVMGIKGWTGGNNKVFFLFTSSGEGSCYNASNCSYTQYCAYHTFFSSGGVNVIYGNEPFGNPSVCAGGTPSPNNDAAADSAASALTHELTEAITDPLLNAWYGGSGVASEIGDLCNGYMGYMGWDGGLANEYWNGHYYAVQTEYSNYLSGFYMIVNGINGPTGCFNVGPEL
jgi:Phosphate-induced protein 1 conserved region